VSTLSREGPSHHREGSGPSHALDDPHPAVAKLRTRTEFTELVPRCRPLPLAGSPVDIYLESPPHPPTLLSPGRSSSFPTSGFQADQRESTHSWADIRGVFVP